MWRGMRLLCKDVPSLSTIFLFLSRQHGEIDEHIFNKNAVARSGIIYKDVSYSPDELAVLDDGAA